MLKKMPILLVSLILGLLMIGPYLPHPVLQGLYALSLSLKSLIMMFLPFLIFSLLYKAARQLSHAASGILLSIFVGLIFSNALATYLSQFIGHWIYQIDFSLAPPTEADALHPLWALSFPKLVPNPLAMMMGMILGLSAKYLPQGYTQNIDHGLNRLIHGLMHALSWIMVPFIAGFVLKMQSEGLLAMVFKDYLTIFGIIGLSQVIYIGFYYGLVHRFSPARALNHLKDMLPAFLTGFTAMSSAAAMPLTILATEKNTQDKVVARSIIPATVNVHLIGDCIAIPIVAFALLKQFGIAEPGALQYLTFVAYFVIAKFSVAAVPGGGVIVMLPILESQLGFSPDMSALMTAIYLLFDPFITGMNILGNGAFAKGMDVLLARRPLKTSDPIAAENQASINMEG